MGHRPAARRPRGGAHRGNGEGGRRRGRVGKESRVGVHERRSELLGHSTDGRGGRAVGAAPSAAPSDDPDGHARATRLAGGDRGAEVALLEDDDVGPLAVELLADHLDDVRRALVEEQDRGHLFRRRYTSALADRLLGVHHGLSQSPGPLRSRDAAPGQVGTQPVTDGHQHLVPGALPGQCERNQRIHVPEGRQGRQHDLHTITVSLAAPAETRNQIIAVLDGNTTRPGPPSRRTIPSSYVSAYWPAY